MDFEALLRVLRHRGLVPRLGSDGRLAVAGPSAQLDEGLRQALCTHRARLLALCLGNETLVALREGPAAWPLLLVPGLAAQPQSFAALAACADWRRPLYGVATPPPGTAPTLEGLVAWLAERLAPMAQAPYVLGGHSFGGLVACALAERLARQGRPPAFLVLLDARCPSPEDERLAESRLREFFLSCVSALAGRRPNLEPHRSDLLEALLCPASWSQGLPPHIDRVGLTSLWQRCQEGQAQFLAFRPGRPPAPVLAVVARQVPPGSAPTLHEAEAAVLRLDTDHEGVLGVPSAQAVARFIEAQVSS